MSQRSKILKSRNSWKGKAVSRADELRYLRKELARVKGERDNYKKRLREAKKHSKDKKGKDRKDEDNTPAVCDKSDLVFIALQLFCVARIGFRAVSRVLGVLSRQLGLRKAPCPQTVINWVDRFSIARMQSKHFPVPDRSNKNTPCKRYIWMIDTTITLGGLKILCVLAIEADYCAKYGKGEEKAPTLRDVCCIGVGVAASWKGEDIADFLLEVIHSAGRPVAFLKDGGTDLAKAVKVLGERGHTARSIDDVSHVVANLLKYEYGDHPLFHTFVSACGEVSRKLKQSILACLAPPKVSTNARFMNLHRLVAWADRLLKHSPAGRAASGSLLAKLRASLDRLPSCRSFIARFLRDAAPLLKCQEILKTRGLSEKTAQECRSLMKAIPPHSPVRAGFINWLEAQLEIAGELRLRETGLPVSSDSIESLFGVAKTLGAGEVKDANRIAARLPAMCGEVTREDARRTLEISVAQQKQIMGGLSSLTRQRREVLQNPGRLESVISGDANQRFELIAGTENRSKNHEFNGISIYYKNSSGPAVEWRDKAVFFPDGSLTGFAAAG